MMLATGLGQRRSTSASFVCVYIWALSGNCSTCNSLPSTFREVTWTACLRAHAAGSIDGGVVCADGVCGREKLLSMKYEAMGFDCACDLTRCFVHVATHDVNSYMHRNARRSRAAVQALCFFSAPNRVCVLSAFLMGFATQLVFKYLRVQVLRLSNRWSFMCHHPLGTLPTRARATLNTLDSCILRYTHQTYRQRAILSASCVASVVSLSKICKCSSVGSVPSA